MRRGVLFVQPLQNTQAAHNFAPYSGDLIGLPCDRNHLVFRWGDNDCKILFSVCRRGNAASCHFASDKKGLRKLKQAINEFTAFVFDLFKWCIMSIAIVSKSSIGRLIEKCGYMAFAEYEDGDIAYMRLKNV